MHKSVSRFFVLALAVMALMMFAMPAGAAITSTSDFEDFLPGSVNYQAAGGCTTTTTTLGYTIPDPYGSCWTAVDEWGFGRNWDQAIMDDGSGNLVWRYSNAVGTFGFSDAPNPPSAAQVAGETGAALYNDRGPNHTTPTGPAARAFASVPTFHGSFLFKSATGVAQPGLVIEVSPAPRQSAYRLSYVKIVDNGVDGFDLVFEENTPGNNFAVTTIAEGLSYTDWHKFDIFIEFVDGVNGDNSGNDIVTVMVNDAIVHTGTSWETLFYEDITQTYPDPIAVDTLMFRAEKPDVPASLGGGLYFDDVVVDNAVAPPPPPAVDPSGDAQICADGTVNIAINNVEDLYGYQFKATYNPLLVSAVGALDYSFFDVDGDGSSPGGWSGGPCSGGVCQFARTEKYPDDPVSGSGVVASIDFTSLYADATSFTLQITDLKLTDRDGFVIEAVPGSFEVDVCGSTTISGKIGLQGRPWMMGVGISALGLGFEVEATGPYGTIPGTITDFADGSYEITGVKFFSSGTDYTVRADHSLYLEAETATPVTVSSLTAPVINLDTTLFGGDARDNGGVGVGDVTCIAGVFNTSPAPTPGDPLVCGSNPLSSPDINADNVINIQDLSIAGGNFLRPEPTDW